MDVRKWDVVCIMRSSLRSPALVTLLALSFGSLHCGGEDSADDGGATRPVAGNGGRSGSAGNSGGAGGSASGQGGALGGQGGNKGGAAGSSGALGGGAGGTAGQSGAGGAAGGPLGPEICSNGLDDDGNGLPDASTCQQDCPPVAGDGICSGFPGVEDCSVSDCVSRPECTCNNGANGAPCGTKGVCCTFPKVCGQSGGVFTCNDP